MSLSAFGEVFVHLAYVDDSGSEPDSRLVVFGAVMVPIGQFGHLESHASVAIHHLLKNSDLDELEEFKAAALYGGYAPFESVSEDKRLEVIRVLLMALKTCGLSFVYSAVDRNLLDASPYASSEAVDVAFRFCLCGIEDWARQRHEHPPGVIKVGYQDTCVVVCDDTTKRGLKKTLRRTFRFLRPKRNLDHPSLPGYRLWHLHDDLYFGDSKDSIGIQLADLCSWIVRNRILRRAGEDLFDSFADLAIPAAVPPQWEQWRSVLRVAP